jgi:hypothetical protein
MTAFVKSCAIAGGDHEAERRAQHSRPTARDEQPPEPEESDRP